MSKIDDLFKNDINVVNIGIETFKDTVEAQHANLVHVDWRPPAQGNAVLANLLEILDDERIDKANKEAFDRLNAGEPMLVDVVYAKDAIEGMQKTGLDMLVLV